MSKINVLSSEVSDLIAAGEVVERPASVVKELTENSIDAGATKIRIEIAAGGLRMIRISDNGCGMSAEDAHKAFLKHATSKISAKADLFRISTLGFRGEALASISAVSKIKLLTKETGATVGTSICIEGGNMVSDGDAGCAEGTSFEVRDLFYNTPARLKFLKSEATEVGHITYFIEKLALSHPEISFNYIINGIRKFFTSGNGNLQEVIFEMYGKEFTDSMIPVSFDGKGNVVSGFVGKPLSSKPNRNFEVFFVNGRVVRSKILQSALESCYHTSIMIGRYPCCVLMLNINPADIDINVHPSKLDIKFSNEKLISDIICEAVKNALSNDSAIASIAFEKAKKSFSAVKPTINSNSSSVATQKDNPKSENKSEKIKEVKTYGEWSIIDYKKPAAQNANTTSSSQVANMSNVSVPEISDKKSEAFEALPNLFSNVLNTPVATVNYADTITNAKTILAPIAEYDTTKIKPQQPANEIPNYRIAGEVFNTYIILEVFADDGNEILFIDKHALHERMIFERLKKEKIETQILLTPRRCSLGAVETASVLESREDLLNLGFDIEDFDGEIALRSIPAIIDLEDADSVLSEYAAMKKSKTGTQREILDRFLFSVACKAAIKSGFTTPDMEKEALIKNYFENRESLKYCPHGRPITFSLTEKTLEKQFKRIV